MPSLINKLYDQINAVCPIDGVSIGDKLDKSTWRVDLSSSATLAQKTAAQAVVTAFDIVAEELIDSNEKQGQFDLESDARGDAIFAALKNATSAQIASFVLNTYPSPFFTPQQRAVSKLLLTVASLNLRRMS